MVPVLYIRASYVSSTGTIIASSALRPSFPIPYEQRNTDILFTIQKGLRVLNQILSDTPFTRSYPMIPDVVHNVTLQNLTVSLQIINVNGTQQNWVADPSVFPPLYASATRRSDGYSQGSTKVLTRILEMWGEGTATTYNVNLFLLTSANLYSSPCVRYVAPTSVSTEGFFGQVTIIMYYMTVRVVDATNIPRIGEPIVVSSGSETSSLITDATGSIYISTCKTGSVWSVTAVNSNRAVTIYAYSRRSQTYRLVV
jgi:hypothetical protein